MPFDIWDSATNTELVRRSVTTVLEDENLVGPTIAPLVPVRDRRIKRGIIEVEAFGAAPMKARNATPPIFIPKITFTEEYVELADIDEMSPIEEDEWEKLTGDNEFEKVRVGFDILNRAKIMQIRNERRTEIMRWAAFQDNLVVTMADEPGQTMRLRYGLPPANQVTVSPAWTSRASSTPVTNIRAGQKALFTRTGKWGSRIYMGADTWEDFQYSAEIKNLLKPNDSTSAFFIPTVAQVESLLYGGSNGPDRPRPGQPQVQIVITNAGYRDIGQGTARGNNAMTFYLPEGKVLITTEPTIDGEKVAEMPDGRVAVKRTPTSEPEFVQGMQTETLVSSMPPYVHYVRQVSVRIPRINFPQAFYWLQVW